MRNLVILTLLSLITFSVFAQSQIPNDNVTIGKKASTSDKGLVIQSNLGANNPSLLIENTDKVLKYNYNQFRLGDGNAATDKRIIINGSDAEIKFDGTRGKLQFSNDGSLYKDIGSGSSGSTGGITNLDNAGFEDGYVEGWSCSSANADCSEETTSPLVGEKSLKFDPDAQNDYFRSDLKTIPVGINGVGCEARIYYTGGDDNLTFKVVNANTDVLGSLVLPSHSIAGFESVFFLCPTTSAIAGDSDEGKLAILVENTGASASASMTIDETYIGSLIGLSETTLPDAFGANISGQTSPVIDHQYGDVITGCTNNSTGSYSCFFTGLTLTPVCTITFEIGNSVQSAGISFIGSTGITYNTTTAAGADVNAGGMNIKCNKVGADAKQSVQVYKSIPRVADNVNELSVFVEDDGTVSSENADWINGDCSNPSTGVYNCALHPSITSSYFHCTATSATSSGGHVVKFTSMGSGDNLDFNTYTVGTGALSKPSVGTSIVCQKQGSEFKMPTVQPILVNQVESSVTKGIRTESCGVLNGGTPAIDSSSGLCESWVDSVALSATGIVDINIKSGIFSKTPVCSVTPTGSSTTMAVIPVSQLIVTTYARTIATPNSLTDVTFQLSCKGER